jgi:hypothetical protein
MPTSSRDSLISAGGVVHQVNGAVIHNFGWFMASFAFLYRFGHIVLSPKYFDGVLSILLISSFIFIKHKAANSTFGDGPLISFIFIRHRAANPMKTRGICPLVFG